MADWTVEIDAEGVALVVFDMPDRKVNVLSARAIAAFAEIITRIASDAAITGAVIASGKSSGFCAGGGVDDLDDVAGPPEPGETLQVLADDMARLMRDTALFRTLETCGKPISCAIEGAALGGGAEFALACHYRVAADDQAVQFGFPEINIGLMPGGGGISRLPRLVGIQPALKLLLDGKSIGSAEALKIGLVHAVAPPGEVIAAARTWVRAGGEPVQPWDRKGARVPGGLPYAAGVSDGLAVSTAMMRKLKYGNYPAAMNILSGVYEAIQVPFDAALRIELRYLVKTLRSPQAKAMLRSLFLSPKQLKAGSSRPAGIAKTQIRKVAVLGAGLMGAGIAYVQAASGIETVLIDRTQELAEKGKDYSRKIVEKAVARGQMTAAQADVVLARIHPTTLYEAIEGSDMVIEAVFEDRDVKAAATRAAEAYLSAHGIYASNTSTLPISGLAEASVRPGNFIGLHFFSPVERMELVEVIRGDATSDTSLATALDYITQIRKTPIVVKDSRGFYTSRTIAKFAEEPCEMLLEGVAPAIIENVGRMIGMPMSPFALADAIGLDLARHVREQTRADLGDAFIPNATDKIYQFLVQDHGRLGRKTQAGFYTYAEDGSRMLWPGLTGLAQPRITDASSDAVQRDLKNRLLYSMALEAARCMEEGVVLDPREADVGALLGFGFPSWTGGPLSLIDMVGIDVFVAECDNLADRYGERFRPPHTLRTMAASGGGFYASPLISQDARRLLVSSRAV